MTSNDYSDYLLESLPPAMVAAKRWLLYKLIPVEGKKPIKKPYCCDGRPREGKLDTDADNARLCTFNDAVAAFASGGYSGLGFALGQDNGAYWQGIDFDNVSEGGATDVLIKSGLPGYTERSVSGNGWHCIGYGKQFKTLGSRVGVGIEAYCTARYFVVTGDCAGGDIEDLSDYVERELMPLHSRVSGEDVNNSDGTVDIAILRDIRAALNYLALDSNDYDTWVNVGMALKTIEPETTGYGMWLEWSSSYPNFNKAECAAKWRTFNPSSLTYRSIFRWASENGWENPKYTEPVTDEWRSRLITRPGKPAKTLARIENVVLFLSNLEEYKGRFKFNQFSSCIEIDGNPITDLDITTLVCQLERQFYERITAGVVAEGVAMVAHQSAYHPLQDYLLSLKWDGVARVKSLFVDYFGSEDTGYCRDVARSFMVSAVARALNPGCKVDTMLILEGGQGIFKSSFIEELIGLQWYTELTSDIDDAKTYLNMRGKWVMDFGELSMFRRKESEDIKRFITRLSDTFTPPYGKNSVTLLRTCVFFGSTNRDQYFKDDTGNRRFLPVKCFKEADITKLKADRDQLWAEAVQLFRRGWHWWDVRDAAIQQAGRVETDAWVPMLEEWLNENESLHNAYPHECIPDNFVFDYLKIDKNRYDNNVLHRVRSCFRTLGYVWVQIGNGEHRGKRHYKKQN